MLAKINGVFRLSKDVELKYLPSGSSLASLSLVNSTKYKTQSGEQKEESCFIDSVVFGKLAEVANQYLSKGSQVFVTGELKQDTWQDQNGNNRSKHSIKIDSFEMIGSRQEKQPNNNVQNSYNQNPPIVNETDIKIPEIDISDEQIPF